MTSPSRISRKVMNNLARRLSRTSSNETKRSTFTHFLRNLSPDFIRDSCDFNSLFASSTREMIPSYHTTDPALRTLADLAEKHALRADYDRFLLDIIKTGKAGLRFPIPERQPCAHTTPTNAWSCLNEGQIICSKCQIVTYCSKACQAAHSRSHESDCKSSIRSAAWKPGWVVEQRFPSFASSSWLDKGWFKRQDPLALGMNLWGNVPALDALNVSKNEADGRRDYVLGFVASGDLRNIVRTVNGLPPHYSGEITIILNDREPYIVARNLALLLLLGSVPDCARAADLFLHVWYSAFIPFEYHLQLCTIILEFMAEHMQQNGTFTAMLGPQSKLSGILPRTVLRALTEMLAAPHETGDVSKELNRVRFAEHRRDRHERQYCRLEPSHRLALLEYRRSGLVLPFGARSDHFNCPNHLLFSPKGRWLQDDLASPLQSWDVLSVIKGGRSHGAPRADLFGCLYFFLTDEFRTFAQRLSQFRINIHLSCTDAVDLCADIRSGSLEPNGLSRSLTFDRIEVSNILDNEYVGISGVLSSWGSLLSPTNKAATLVGYFMNWPIRQGGANMQTVDAAVVSKLMARMLKEKRLPTPPSKDLATVLQWFGILQGYSHTLTAVYDNSAAFKKYLERQGITEVLRETGLQLKPVHTIVPHRLGGHLGDNINALPHFADGETWYLNVGVGDWMWSERYVEFSRAYGAGHKVAATSVQPQSRRGFLSRLLSLWSK